MGLVDAVYLTNRNFILILKYNWNCYDIVFLFSTEASAQKTVQDMIDGRWIDEFTRAVFVEFLIYNPNTNMYGVMLSVFEFTADGGAFFYCFYAVLWFPHLTRAFDVCIFANRMFAKETLSKEIHYWKFGLKFHFNQEATLVRGVRPIIDFNSSWIYRWFLVMSATQKRVKPLLDFTWISILIELDKFFSAIQIVFKEIQDPS